MNMTHYIIVAKVEDYSAEYYRLRELVEKFFMHFHLYGSFYHVTTTGVSIPLESLSASVRGAIGDEASYYVAQVGAYEMSPTPESPSTVQE